MKKKLLIIYLILILVGTLTTGLLSLSFVKSSYENNINDKLIAKANLINQWILLKYEKKQKIIYYNIAQDYANKTNIRVTFADENGNVLADSFNNSIIFDNKNTRPEIIQAICGQIGIKKRFNNENSQNMLFIAIPPINVGDKNIVTRVAVPLKEIEHLNTIFFINIAVSIFIGIFIAVFIGYTYIDNITKPIKELTIVSKLISQGDFDKKVIVNTNDEIEELANNFNIMGVKLNNMITQLKENNTQLQSILTSMLSGVTAVDNNYNVILMNEAMKKIFDIENEFVTNKPLYQLLKNKKILKVIKDTFVSNRSQKTEVTMSYEYTNKVLNIRTNLINDKEYKKNLIGVLLIVDDITEIKKLENLRKEFVTNVSHELKTPLTIISGFTETLKLNCCKEDINKNRFLDIIYEETLRLRRLIDDLLTLSSIENSSKSKSKEVISLNESITEINYLFRDKLIEKNLILNSEVEKNLFISIINKDWFKQMLINLVDNAIKYTPEGGTINILAYKRQHTLFISVKDNGRGIPNDHIPRVFERFYRVDKGRARKDGGTGLGLSIVKHIVLAFNGTIKLKSEFGKGSEFIIKLPMDKKM